MIYDNTVCPFTVKLYEWNISRLQRFNFKATESNESLDYLSNKSENICDFYVD